MKIPNMELDKDRKGFVTVGRTPPPGENSGMGNELLMETWKRMELVPLDGTPVLVQLSKEMLGSRLHVGRFTEKGVDIIGGRFRSECSDAQYWTELPKIKI